jgi:two-component system, sensor histidine kinase PdtaS
MKKPDDRASEHAALRDKIIGLGEKSFRKSYFPQLQTQLSRLERFRTLLDHSKDGILLVDCETAEIIDANSAASKLAGLDASELQKTPFHELFPSSERGLVLCLLAGDWAGSENVNIVEVEKIGDDDRKSWVEYTININVLHGRRFLVVLARDITERKMHEAKLRTSLREKEALLKEIHHRVKNNLQVISSLLHMQAMATTDDLAQNILRESQTRVKSMALVHERLYQSADFSGIDFVDYLPTMARELLRAYGRRDIQLSVDVEPIHLWIDTAIPLGLIASELVSNSLKHAFPERRRGEITIELHKVSDNEAQLVVSDNGAGFPSATDLHAIRSMGMTLVLGLTKQIDGSIVLDQRASTRLVVTFPLPRAKTVS